MSLLAQTTSPYWSAAGWTMFIFLIAQLLVSSRRVPSSAQGIFAESPICRRTLVSCNARPDSACAFSAIWRV